MSKFFVSFAIATGLVASQASAATAKLTCSYTDLTSYLITVVVEKGLSLSEAEPTADVTEATVWYHGEPTVSIPYAAEGYVSLAEQPAANISWTNRDGAHELVVYAWRLDKKTGLRKALGEYTRPSGKTQPMNCELTAN